ncbi:27684_t:CDS:2, partial [Racocetra persica]
RSSKTVPHCKHLYQNSACKVTNSLQMANFIELLRYLLDMDEFINNLYDPDFMRRTSTDDIIVSHILAGDYMPFFYEWFADHGPYNNNDDMIRSLFKTYLTDLEEEIVLRNNWIT